MAPLITAILVATAAVTRASAQGPSPLSQVIDLLAGLRSKITHDGEVEAATYQEYSKWCHDTSTDAQFSIKTLTSQKDQLEASISELSAQIQVSSSKIEDLAASISASSAELAAATTVREKESVDFGASEKELVEVVDTIARASAILRREMQKNPAAFAQMNRNSAGILQSLDALVDAASFSVADQERLQALLQTATEGADADLGAPAAAVYVSHSSDIFDVLEDLKEKAQEQLSSLRKAEVQARHNYGMLKQALDDQLSADNKDMDSEKSRKASDEEAKGVAQGDLKATEANLKATEDSLAATTATCAAVDSDHEATVKARDEELRVIAEAMEVLKSTTQGAANQTYSLLQVGVSISTRGDLARSEIITLLSNLAKVHHSAALAQLASRITAVVRLGKVGGEEPFAKVKGLITDLILKLQAEASAEATEKSFCDEEMAKTSAKKGELDSEASKLTTEIDQARARSNQLRQEVKELSEELAKLAAEQLEMDKLRQATNANFIQAKKDLMEGLTGVRRALVVLRDYYSQKDESSLLQSSSVQPVKPETFVAGGGSGKSIIDILSVVESDFATTLAKEETSEAAAQEGYEVATQQNRITKAAKEQDVKYKGQESTGLDKRVSELSSDLANTNAELAAVLEYDGKLKERCIGKPESYEARSQRRSAEIAGLKEALSILKSETAFVQRAVKAGRRHSGNLRTVLSPSS